MKILCGLGMQGFLCLGSPRAARIQADGPVGFAYGQPTASHTPNSSANLIQVRSVKPWRAVSPPMRSTVPLPSQFCTMYHIHCLDGLTGAPLCTLSANIPTYLSQSPTKVPLRSISLSTIYQKNSSTNQSITSQKLTSIAPHQQRKQYRGAIHQLRECERPLSHRAESLYQGNDFAPAIASLSHYQHQMQPEANTRQREGPLRIHSLTEGIWQDCTLQQCALALRP